MVLMMKDGSLRY